MFPFYCPCWLLTCCFTGRLRNTDDCATVVSRILCLSEGVQIKKKKGTWPSDETTASAYAQKHAEMDVMKTQVRSGKFTRTQTLTTDKN